MPESVIEDFTLSTLYPVLIISYEKFLKFHESIVAAKIDLVICDEGHRLKNEAIKISQCLQTLSTRKRIILTGTPIQVQLTPLTFFPPLTLTPVCNLSGGPFPERPWRVLCHGQFCEPLIPGDSRQLQKDL